MDPPPAGFLNHDGGEKRAGGPPPGRSAGPQGGADLPIGARTAAAWSDLADRIKPARRGKPMRGAGDGWTSLGGCALEWGTDLTCAHSMGGLRLRSVTFGRARLLFPSVGPGAVL